MTKNQVIAEHVIVTFFEGVIGYLVINQTNLSTDWKTVGIGAVMFGLSLAYNVLRQSAPTIPTVPVTPTVVTPTITPPVPSPLDTPPTTSV